MSLARKLVLLVVSALLALGVVALVGIFGLKTSQSMMDEVAKVRLPSILGLEIVSEGMTAIRSDNRMVGLLLVQSAKPEEYAKLNQHKKETWQHIQRGWNIYEPLPQTAEEAVLWKRFLEEWASWKKLDERISAEIGRLAGSLTDEERSKVKNDYLAAIYAAVPHFDKAEASLNEIVRLNEEIGQKAALTAEESGQRTMTSMMVISALAAVLVGVLGVSIGTNVFNTIGGEPDEAKGVVERIAAGDLTHPITVKPGDTTSLIAAQQKMQTGLTGLVREISGAVTRTESSADSLASAAHQVASASAETSDAASAMAASVEELSVSISQVSENAGMALGVAEKTGGLSVDGGVVIDRAIAEINRIADTVRATADKMNALSENSRQISSVVQVIKDVADQTNLLALNAAIEAARAGEAGRGFAVVADEVRKLAERTTGATVEIGNMISRIQSDTEQSVQTMEGAVAQVDKGVSLASEAGEAISEIRNGVEQLVAMVNDMVNSIREQSVASQQIAQRVEHVAQASEENNAAAQQTSESADTLKGLAQTLKSSIGRFRTA